MVLQRVKRVVMRARPLQYLRSICSCRGWAEANELNANFKYVFQLVRPGHSAVTKRTATMKRNNTAASSNLHHNGLTIVRPTALMHSRLATNDCISWIIKSTWCSRNASMKHNRECCYFAIIHSIQNLHLSAKPSKKGFLVWIVVLFLLALFICLYEAPVV